MKAGIITHYNVHNHGAQLQLYALSKQLGRLKINITYLSVLFLTTLGIFFQKELEERCIITTRERHLIIFDGRIILRESIIRKPLTLTLLFLEVMKFSALNRDSPLVFGGWAFHVIK